MHFQIQEKKLTTQIFNKKIFKKLQSHIYKIGMNLI